MATFTSADDLQGAQFVDANLRGARMVNSDLSGAVMRQAVVDGSVERMLNLRPQALREATNLLIDDPDVDVHDSLCGSPGRPIRACQGACLVPCGGLDAAATVLGRERRGASAVRARDLVRPIALIAPKRPRARRKAPGSAGAGRGPR